jgi:hypothetical protein
MTCHFPEWMYKIKNTFDPNTATDPANYPTGKKK